MTTPNQDDIPELVTRTYDVDVRLTASQWVTMRVEAFSEDDACDRAQGLALPHGQWEWDQEGTYSEAKLVEDTP